MATPATLPAGFDGWDDSSALGGMPPKTLPADFCGFDKTPSALPAKDTVGDFYRGERARVAAAPVAPSFPSGPRIPFGASSSQSLADVAIEQTSGPDYALRSNAPPPQTIRQQVRSFGAGSTITPVSRAPISQPAAHPAANLREADVGLWEGTGDNAFNANPAMKKFAADSAAEGLGGELPGGAVTGKAAIKTAADTGKDIYQGSVNTVGQTGDQWDRQQFVKGITQLVSGGSKAMIALSAPELMELGAAADAGNVAAQASIVKIIGSATAGDLASAASGKVSDKLNLSPETKDLIQTTAFFLPTLAGAMAFKGGVGVDAEGNPGVGVASKGGGFRAGAVGTSEAYDIRVQAGNTRVGVKIPRNQPPPPPPDPARILYDQQSEAGTNAIMRAAVKEQQAKTMVNGGPPPPPPGLPLPDSMQKGAITQQTTSNIAEMIHNAPPAQHPDLIMEAHGKLSEYIEKQGRIIGPDGKLQLAENPLQAAKLAQKIINDEVDRQSQAAADSAQQQADALKQQQDEADKSKEEAQKPGPNGEPSPEDQQLQRVKTIIEGTTPKPGQNLNETVMRNLNVDRPTAHALIQRYQTESAAAQMPTVGSAKEPVVEESQATVDAQVDALKRGDIHVVMLPQGSRYIPKLPEGIKMMAVRGAAPGAGYYLYSPQQIQAATIREAAKAGTHGDLLGHVTPKLELDETKPTVVIQAQDKATGTPIQDSEVHLERVAAQVASLQERHPEAHVVVRPTHEVIAERLAEHQQDGAPATLPADFNFEEHPDETKSATDAQSDVISTQSGTTLHEDRRVDDKRRKEVSEMTPEELRKELLTNPTTDLPNRRAFEEAEKKTPAKAVAMSDADGLKALNDKFGYHAGDELLRAKAEALNAAGVEAYHDKGDEFLYRGESKEEIGEKLEAARALLRDRAIDVKTNDGKVVTFKGADFSHGTGEDLNDAERRLKEHKAERESRGERARGELRGISETGSGDGGVDQSPAERVASTSTALVIKGQRVAFTDRSGIEREGVVSHVDDRITRVGKYDVPNNKVLRSLPPVESEANADERRPENDGATEGLSERQDEAPEGIQEHHSGIGAIIPDRIKSMVDEFIHSDDKITDGDFQRGMMRQTRGQMDRRIAMAAKVLEVSRSEWSKRSKEDSIDFFNAVENVDGKTVADLSPADRALANHFKAQFDTMKTDLQELKPNVLQDYIENYFPHIWDRQAAASQTLNQVLSGSKPFAGKGSFLKQRTIPTIQDGLDMGLTPVSYNPVDLFLMKYQEQSRFLMAHQTLENMKAAGTAKYVPLGDKAPDGWQQLDDRIGTVHRRITGINEDKLEDATKPLSYPGGKKKMPGAFAEDIDGAKFDALVIAGHYYAPPDAAKVFNNFVSKGIAGRSQIYDGLRWANNNINAFQLGISAFHASTTGIVAVASDIAAGLKQVTEGEVATGTKNLAQGLTFFPSIVSTLRNGSKLMQEYLEPGSYAKFAKEAEALSDAGGRIKQNPIEVKPLQRVLQDIRHGELVKGASHVPSALIELSTRPIMDYWVPRMKVGAFYDMAHSILARSAREGWSAQKTRSDVQKAWNSVDNRFGQMVYDNLFWHKAVKDSLMLATRSVGWNVGTIRELGGAVGDTAKAAGRAAAGERPAVTEKMAFVAGLTIATAMVGVTLGYIWRKQWPHSLKDCFYPMRADGTRLSIPGYIKDVFAYNHSPVQTLLNKVSPAFEMAFELYQNKDFYNVEIVPGGIKNGDDSVSDKAKLLGKYLLGEMVPFSMRGSDKLTEASGGGVAEGIGGKLKAALKHPGDTVLGQLGFQPAPAYIQHSDAMNAASDYARENHPLGTRTEREFERQQVRHAVQEMYRTGHVDREQIAEYQKSGLISSKDVRSAILNAKVNPIVRTSRELTLDQVLKVYEKADNQEKVLLRPVLEKKATREINEEPDPERRSELRSAVVAALGKAKSSGSQMVATNR